MTYLSLAAHYRWSSSPIKSAFPLYPVKFHLQHLGMIALCMAMPFQLSAVGAEPVDSASNPFLADPLRSLSTTASEPVRISATIEATADTKVLSVSAVLGPGWHLYSLDQKPGGPKPTKISKKYTNFLE